VRKEKGKKSKLHPEILTVGTLHPGHLLMYASSIAVETTLYYINILINE
jgi:hypothetical protein